MMRYIKISFLGLVVFLAVLCVGLAIWTEPMPDHPFFDEKKGVEVIAHRGGRHLWPENTLYGFQQAVDLGVDILEMDVRSTKDGHLVVIHDATVDRTTNGTGQIGDFTLEELKQLDAGYRWSRDKKQTFPMRDQGIIIPTLTEVLEAFPQMRMVIEIKEREADVVASLGHLIRQYQMQDRVVIGCFDSDIIKRFRELFPEIATSPGLTESFIFYALCRLHLGFVYHPNVEVLQFPHKLGPFDTKHPSLLMGAHQNNIQVQIWTVNNNKDMQHLIKRGVDGIMTDRPDRLLAILERLPKQRVK